MNPSYLFLICGVVIQNLALLMQKHALNNLHLKPWEGANIFMNFFMLATNPYIFFSVVCSFLSLGCWLIALSKLELSTAYPMVSMGYVISIFVGYYVFGESMPALKIIGVALIIGGVMCLSRA